MQLQVGCALRFRFALACSSRSDARSGFASHAAPGQTRAQVSLRVQLQDGRALRFHFACSSRTDARSGFALRAAPGRTRAQVSHRVQLQYGRALKLNSHSDQIIRILQSTKADESGPITCHQLRHIRARAQAPCSLRSEHARASCPSSPTSAVVPPQFSRNQVNQVRRKWPNHLPQIEAHQGYIPSPMWPALRARTCIALISPHPPFSPLPRSPSQRQGCPRPFHQRCFSLITSLTRTCDSSVYAH